MLIEGFWVLYSWSVWSDWVSEGFGHFLADQGVWGTFQTGFRGLVHFSDVQDVFGHFSAGLRYFTFHFVGMVLDFGELGGQLKSAKTSKQS